MHLLPHARRADLHPAVFWASDKFDPSKPDAESTPDYRLAPASPLRVVIVEDEAIIAMELEMLLEDLGAEVVGIASSAAEAEDLVNAYRPDIVTMDFDIKGDRDGVSAAQGIFERYGIRAIFISGFSDPETRQRAEACQAIAWIKKPVNPVDLAAALEGLEPSEG